MSRPPSIAARALEPLVASFWILFLIWTLLVAAIWTLGFGEAELHAAIANPDLRAALGFFLGVLDPAWFTLAAANSYLALAAAEGLATVRRWAVIILASVAAVALVSTATEWPMGPIRFTDRLGARIGSVPFGLLPLWFALIVGARGLVLWLAPKMSHLRAALIAGMVAMFSDVNLEPLAWKARAFWIWYPAEVSPPAWPPWQNFATWFVVAAALIFTMRETRVATSAKLEKPALILLILNAVFLATHLARWRQN